MRKEVQTLAALRRSLLLSCAAVLTSVGFAAHAQTRPATVTAPADAAATTSPGTVSEVVVTGTRIAGAAPVGSPMQTIDAKQLQQIAATNVVDALNEMPVFSGSGQNQAVSGSVGPGVRGVNSARESDINLRDLGPRATLVLFDDFQTPPAGATGRTIDSSTIPSVAVQRVDVLMDGASAIYGSEAIAGVVNFIPYTRYEGSLTRAQYSVANGFDTYKVSELLGHEWDGGAFVGAFEYSDQSHLLGTSRSWWRSDLTSEGGANYDATQCNPGTIVAGGVSYAIPAGGVTPATASSLIPGTSNRCDLERLVDLLPAQKQISGYLSFEQNLASNLKFFARAVYSRRDFNVNDIAVGSQIRTASIVVPNTNPFFVAPPGTNPASETVNYYFQNEFNYSGYQDYLQTFVGLNWDVFRDWKASAIYSYGKTNSYLLTYGILSPALTAAATSTNPATALNVFGGPNSPSVINSIFSSVYDPSANAATHDVQAQANGTLFDLPAGPVKLAFGGEYYYLSNPAFNHLGNIATYAANFSYEDPTRSVWSGFGELLVPILSSEQNVPGVYSLDLSVAGRIDNYSDAGKTTNPKIGVNWRPFSELLVRFSYGTSFKAPYQNDLYANAVGSSLIYTTLIDPLSATKSSSGIEISSGNSSLQPETATTYSVSGEYRPTWAPGLSVTADWFKINYQNAVGSLVLSTALQNPLLAPYVIRNPTAAQIASLLATGPGRHVNFPAPLTPVSWIVDGRPQNLGGILLDGIDFGANYPFETSIGHFVAGVSGTYNLDYLVQALKGGPFVNQLNTIYSPLRFRAQASLSWQNGPWSAQTFVNYVNRYSNNLVAPSQSIAAYTKVDLNVAYDIHSGNTLVDGTELGLQLRNLFNAKPPFANILGGADLTVADPVGLMATFSVSKKF